MLTTKYKQFPSLFKPGARMGRAIFSLFLIQLALLSGALPARADNSAVILVRHAEKTAEANDPQLSEAGIQRAEQLATLLADANVTAIYSTDFSRTRNTAAPLANARGLEIMLYDPANPGQLVDSLKKTPGRFLVVGHSNTVPDLVERLGGSPGSAMDEKTEYDRLYVLTFGEGKTTTVLLRY